MGAGDKWLTRPRVWAPWELSPEKVTQQAHYSGDQCEQRAVGATGIHKPTEGVRTPDLKDEQELGSWGGGVGCLGAMPTPDPSPGGSAFTGLVVPEPPGQSDLRRGREWETHRKRMAEGQRHAKAPERRAFEKRWQPLPQRPFGNILVDGWNLSCWI